MTTKFLDVPCPAEVRSHFPEFDWKNASLAERCVHLARAHERMKVREITANWGPWVRLYLAVAGWKSPAPWCAAFVYYTLVQCGADRSRLWKNPASTYSMVMWARKNNRLSKKSARRGNAFVWNTRGASPRGHTGWIVQDAQSYFVTIEGNTNRYRGREGDGVYQCQRTFNELKKNASGSLLWGAVNLDGLEI
jgi:hypothetical protein